MLLLYVHCLPPPPFRKKPSLTHINEPDTSNLQSNFLCVLRFFWILSSHISLCLPNDIIRLNFVNKVIVAYLIGTFDYALLALICLYLDCRDASALWDVTVSGSESNCLLTAQQDADYEVEQWYVKHKYFIVLLHRQHVSTYIHVIFRPSFTDKSIKCYICWDPVMLTEVKYIKT